MSFSTPNSTWVPKSASEHAEIVLSKINSILAPLSISITPSLGNVVWLFCLGIGEVAALFDTYLTKAKDSFNPALCDDDQILHMLSVTGLTRIPASPSTLSVQFTATSDGALSVPAGTHVRILNQVYTFLVDTTTSVPASSTVSISTTCDTTGPIQVAPGQVSGISETLAHFSSVSNSSYTVIGRDIETISALRLRIVKGLGTFNNLEGFTNALRSLPNVNQAKVYFNESTTTPLTLPGSITVPTRTLYIVISGSSDRIANTWAERSMAPTYGTQSQTYHTLSGQSIDVKYDYATSQDIYVKVYVSSKYTRQQGYNVKVAEAITALNNTEEIGRTVTVESILKSLSDFLYATINSAEVSLDGVTYGRTAVINSFSIPNFTSNKISIVEEP